VTPKEWKRKRKSTMWTITIPPRDAKRASTRMLLKDTSSNPRIREPDRSSKGTGYLFDVPLQTGTIGSTKSVYTQAKLWALSVKPKDYLNKRVLSKIHPGTRVEFQRLSTFFCLIRRMRQRAGDQTVSGIRRPRKTIGFLYNLLSKIEGVKRSCFADTLCRRYIVHTLKSLRETASLVIASELGQWSIR